MEQAYLPTTSAANAKRLLDNLARSLDENHPRAAASLREGLDETLTNQSHGLTGPFCTLTCDDQRHRKIKRNDMQCVTPGENMAQWRDDLSLGAPPSSRARSLSTPGTPTSASRHLPMPSWTGWSTTPYRLNMDGPSMRRLNAGLTSGETSDKQPK